MDYPNLNDQKKRLNVFFLINKAGAMAGMNIQKVNQHIHNTIDSFKMFEKNVTDEFDIWLSVMSFDNEARIEIPLTELEEFVYYEEDFCRGMRRYETVFKRLNEGLNRNDFMQYPGKKCRPMIVLCTMGEDVLGSEAVAALEQLQQNRWFMHADRHLVYVDGCDKKEAYEHFNGFVNNEECCHSVEEPLRIKNIIFGNPDSGLSVTDF